VPLHAVYAGSFDPITNGHLDVIQRGAALFDRVSVAIGMNRKKSYLLDIDQRTALAERAIEGLDNVQVVSFEGLLVDCVQSLDAQVILRGLRALSDFDMEFRNGLANRDLAGIETAFLVTDPQLLFVSSSLIKEIAAHGGDVSRYVPPGVEEALSAAFEARNT